MIKVVLYSPKSLQQQLIIHFKLIQLFVCWLANFLPQIKKVFFENINKKESVKKCKPTQSPHNFDMRRSSLHRIVPQCDAIITWTP